LSTDAQISRCKQVITEFLPHSEHTETRVIYVWEKNLWFSCESHKTLKHTAQRKSRDFNEY
jgi:hypothetical protein